MMKSMAMAASPGKWATSIQDSSRKTSVRAGA